MAAGSYLFYLTVPLEPLLKSGQEDLFQCFRLRWNLITGQLLGHGSRGAGDVRSQLCSGFSGLTVADTGFWIAEARHGDQFPLLSHCRLGDRASMGMPVWPPGARGQSQSPQEIA